MNCRVNGGKQTTKTSLRCSYADLQLILKQTKTYRIRQLAVDIRLYCGLSIYSYAAGSNVSKMDRTKTLPDDRPTFNLCASLVLIPWFQGCLKQDHSQSSSPTMEIINKVHLAQRLNQFILGEFFQTKCL